MQSTTSRLKWLPKTVFRHRLNINGQETRVECLAERPLAPAEFETIIRESAGGQLSRFVEIACEAASRVCFPEMKLGESKHLFYANVNIGTAILTQEVLYEEVNETSVPAIGEDVSAG